ncbi:hypothetical protein H0H87_004610 [Tephrocybe sp. NHM501043]|nr:hypothetical protein H0H87_004610 [Tephrocybe sp. NHM501043]
MALLGEIHDLLGEPSIQRVLQVHPNDPDADAAVSFPPALLGAIQSCQLPRTPVRLGVSIAQDAFGMSPKKHHEVWRMTSYIASLGLPADTHIVDVGAGQGYLTRALHAHFGTAALALDSDQVQTHGSLARGARVSGIAHRTVHLTPASLLAAIDDWIPPGPTPTPVLLVALHACGSLTPDLFRALLALPPKSSWYPAAAVAVGCCYNLMSPPHDFPLSPSPLPPLPASAYQMAAQIPDTWFLSHEHTQRAALATKKVVWRAILGRLFDATIPSTEPAVTETGSTPAMRRLGRLPDAAYDSWDRFLSIASARIGVDLSSASLPPAPPPPTSTASLPIPHLYPAPDAAATADAHNPPNIPLQAHLAALHTLRCLLGPVVESYIILDRVAWLRAQLAAHDGPLAGYTVEHVNLFDQATGSGRNIALVVRPGGTP